MSHEDGFHGVIPYLPTPLKPNGDVDAEALGRLVEHLIAAGVNGVTPLGSTGEFAYLSRIQRQTVVEATIEAAAGRVPVIAGVAQTASDAAVAEARHYAKAGADGILGVLEAYFPLRDEDVAGYFEALAAATDLPLALYTNPNFQRADLSLATLERLSRVETIRYLKDASTNTGRLLTVIQRTEGRLRIFAASSHITVAVMVIGGVGWMAGPSCLIPAQSLELYRLCREKRWDEAMALQHKLWAVNQVFARHNLAGAVKAGLRLQGFEMGDAVRPQAPLGEAAVAEIRAALIGAGALAA